MFLASLSDGSTHLGLFFGSILLVYVSVVSEQCHFCYDPALHFFIFSFSLTKISSTMLNASGTFEQTSLCCNSSLCYSLQGKHSMFYFYYCLLAMVTLYTVFIRLRKFPLMLSLLRAFTLSWVNVGFWSNVFSASVELIITFPLDSVNVLTFFCWFPNIKPTVTSWNNTDLGVLVLKY